jgi:hypothetical protein
MELINKKLRLPKNYYQKPGYEPVLLYMFYLANPNSDILHVFLIGRLVAIKSTQKRVV